MHLTNLVTSKFLCFCVKCFCVFAPLSRLHSLCACATKWRVPRLSIQPLLLLIGNGYPLCRGRYFRILDFRMDTHNICGFCENKQQTNACVSVTRSLFESHKLNFHGSRPNSGLFHGREQNFQIQGLFPFSRVLGNPGMHSRVKFIVCHT